MTLLTLPDAQGSGLSERAKALVFEDPRSRELLGQIRAVAGADAPVLLLGETGTGRELIARYIHELSLRRSGPFLSVDCASFAGIELEAELFGHEKDALPGATGARTGVLESAEGGTVLLDAIGDMPQNIQAKLVRVLEDQQFRRLGARRYAPINLRFIIASSVQLQEAVRAGHFRADLLRMISGNPIEVAPLRKRRGDILPLARHFLQLYQQRIGIGSRSLSNEAERALVEHAFPGNIRELETVIHHALLRCRGRFIVPEDLRLNQQPAVAVVSAEPPPQDLERALNRLFEQSPPHLYQTIDEAVMRTAYRFSSQNQLKTARLLGLSRNVVRARLIQYGEVPGVLRSTPERAAPAAARKRSNGRARHVVRFGYQPFGLLKLLRAQGTLERELSQQGFRVEWRHFPSGIRLVEAFQRGELSIGVVGEGPPIFAQASNVPIVYVAAEAPAPEGEAIVVHQDSPIRSVSGLRGKRVALLRGSNAHYLLIRALEEAGLSYADIAPKFVFQEAARARFQHRDVDALAIGDPVLAEVQRDLPVRVLRDGRGLTKNPAYYVASAEFAAAHPAVLELFRRELAKVQRWASEHLEEAAFALAPQLGPAREAVGVALKRSLGESLRRPEVIASQQRVADAFYRLKLIPREVSVAEATWPLE
ncbi:MAG TPA: aliphatic sulfonate ABC transporter substrate-binding protein [Polyangiaceae bacterium]|nr:aliphatic sulfonate ABC transporter substrate-binding protein [Polyangiaceae bacterium]